MIKNNVGEKELESSSGQADPTIIFLYPTLTGKMKETKEAPLANDANTATVSDSLTEEQVKEFLYQSPMKLRN